MAEKTDGPDVVTVWIRRVARILAIIVIAFTLFMCVAHVVGPDEHAVDDYPPIENLLPALMSVSVFSLALAWRWERLAGILNIGFFVVTLLLDWVIRGSFLPLGAVPTLVLAIVRGVLFLVCWWRARHN